MKKKIRSKVFDKSGFPIMTDIGFKFVKLIEAGILNAESVHKLITKKFMSSNEAIGDDRSQ